MSRKWECLGQWKDISPSWRWTQAGEKGTGGCGSHGNSLLWFDTGRTADWQKWVQAPCTHCHVRPWSHSPEFEEQPHPCRMLPSLPSGDVAKSHATAWVSSHHPPASPVSCETCSESDGPPCLLLLPCSSLGPRKWVQVGDQLTHRLVVKGDGYLWAIHKVLRLAKKSTQLFLYDLMENLNELFFTNLVCITGLPRRPSGKEWPTSAGSTGD